MSTRTTWHTSSLGKLTYNFLNQEEKMNDCRDHYRSFSTEKNPLTSSGFGYDLTRSLGNRVHVGKQLFVSNKRVFAENNTTSVCKWRRQLPTNDPTRGKEARYTREPILAEPGHRITVGGSYHVDQGNHLLSSGCFVD